MEITFNEQTNKKSQENAELKMIRRQMAPSSCAYSISEFFTFPPRERKISCLAHVMNIFFHLGHLNRRRCHAVDYDDSSMMNRKLAQRSASIEKVMIFFLFPHFRWIARFPDVLAFSLVYMSKEEHNNTYNAPRASICLRCHCWE